MKEPQCAHPPPLHNDDVIGSNWYLLHYHYQVEEDEDKEEQVKEPQCAHPPPLDNDVTGFYQCLCLSKAEVKTKNLSFWCSTRFIRKKVTRLTKKTV